MFFLKSIMQDDETLGGSLKLKDIWAGGVGIGSQLITAFGRNPSSQVGYNTAGGVFAIQGSPMPHSQRFDDSNYQTQLALAAAQRQQGGLGFDAAAGGILGFVSNNPLLVGGIALGAFLLFREPPRRR